MCWQRGALWEGSSGDRRNLVTLWHLAGAPGTSPLCPLLTPLRAGSSMYGYGDSDGPGFQALGDELVSGREPAHAMLNIAIWPGVGSASASADRFGLRVSTLASEIRGPSLHDLAPPVQQVRAGVGGLGLIADLVCKRRLRHLTRHARLRAPVAERGPHPVGRSCDAETPEQLAEHRGVDPSSLRGPDRRSTGSRHGARAGFQGADLDPRTAGVGGVPRVHIDIGVLVHGIAIPMCAPPIPHVAGGVAVAPRPQDRRCRSGGSGRGGSDPPLSMPGTASGRVGCARPSTLRREVAPVQQSRAGRPSSAAASAAYQRIRPPVAAFHQLGGSASRPSEVGVGARPSPKLPRGG